MHNSELQLDEELTRWKEWSLNADQSEEGWESNYPGWEQLMTLAKMLMLEKSLKEKSLLNLEKCWEISHEDEVLADHARKNYIDCEELLVYLAESQLPEVRWQVYSALEIGDQSALALLKKGLKDADSYCKRRAILSIAKHCPSEDAEFLATPLLTSEDPYIRQAAIELVLASNDQEFIRNAKTLLGNDPVDHVRLASKKL